jgi:hypothetical protein
MNVVEALVIYEPVAVIVAGEAGDRSTLVLQCAAVDAARHPDVECARAAANDIGGIVVGFHGSWPVAIAS